MIFCILFQRKPRGPIAGSKVRDASRVIHLVVIDTSVFIRSNVATCASNYEISSEKLPIPFLYLILYALEGEV